MTGAGIAPLPVQRPIPVWFGASAPRALRRAGRAADGWFPQLPPGPRLDEARAIVSAGATAAGRDPSQMGMEGRVKLRAGDVGRLVEGVWAWRDAGATHVSINTMGAGFASVEDHLAALEAAATALGLG